MSKLKPAPSVSNPLNIESFCIARNPWRNLGGQTRSQVKSPVGIRTCQKLIFRMLLSL